MTEKFTLKKYLVGDRKFYSHVLIILIPIIVQNTVTNVISLVDNVMVGSIGTYEMSAVAIVNQLLFIFYLCIFGGISGVGIFTAQFAGAANTQGVKSCFRLKIYITYAMLTLAMIIFMVFPKQLISIYLAKNTTPEAAEQTISFAIEYLDIMLIGLIPFTLTQIYSSTLRETGETKLPMAASIIAIIINLCLNYLLIFGNKCLSALPFAPLGVAGAAIATVTARFIESAIIIIYVHTKQEHFPFIKKLYSTLRVEKSFCIEVIKKGTPLLINEFMWSLGMAMLMQCYSVRGLDVVAATNIASTIANIFNVVFISMGNAIAIIVGQHLGAGKTTAAKLTVWRIITVAVLSCIVMGGTLFAISSMIPQMYNTSAEVKHTAASLIRIHCMAMPLLAFSHCCYFTLRSGGKTLTTMLFDCGFVWGISYTAAFVIAHFTNLPILPFFAIIHALEIIKCIIGFILVKKEVWVNKVIG